MNFLLAAAIVMEPGARKAAERTIPVPVEGVSTAMQKLIAAPYPPVYERHPGNASAWKSFVKEVSQESLDELPGLITKMQVKVTEETIAGVPVYRIEPLNLPEKNRDRLLIHVHGGGYVLFPGKAGIGEGVMLAGWGGFKVISIDYRMPPDFPYPAALDDAMAVWKEVVKQADPKKMAIFGSSTGGGLTLAMALRARDEKLPLPAAIAPGTPWADLSETGDTYFANEGVDNVLVTWKGWLGDAAKLYANGRNLKEPYLSPIYGDFQGLPPAILTTGTRDLFLSNTVRTHRKLLRAGVEAELNVYEGQSHAQFMDDPDAPETKEAFTDIARFLDRHLLN